MSEKLARVHWQMGQPLLPDHFRVQEDALLADLEMRLRYSGVPHYGIAELDWRESLLNDGVLSLSKFSMITPAGVLLSTAGNARIVSPLNLNATGNTQAQVYCHLMEAGTSSDSDEMDNDDNVVRAIYELHLSCDAGMTGALESIKIAEFNKDVEESWRLAENFVPPLLLIGSSPFLKRSINLLSMQLDVFAENLSDKIAASYLSAENLHGSKECLASVFRLQRLLLNLEGQIGRHPYDFYETLLDFYSTLCTYHNNNPMIVANLLYRHEALGPAFQQLLELIFSELKTAKSNVPYLPFEQENGRFTVTLPPDVREATAVYLLVQKNHVQAQLDLSQMKLASPSRIPVVHKLALPGIPFIRIDRPPFQHAFGTEVDFYELGTGEEMDYALRELALGFYRPTEVEDFVPYIYWRAG